MIKAGADPLPSELPTVLADSFCEAPIWKNFLIAYAVMLPRSHDRLRWNTE